MESMFNTESVIKNRGLVEYLPIWLPLKLGNLVPSVGEKKPVLIETEVLKEGVEYSLIYAPHDNLICPEPQLIGGLEGINQFYLIQCALSHQPRPLEQYDIFEDRDLDNLIKNGLAESGTELYIAEILEVTPFIEFCRNTQVNSREENPSEGESALWWIKGCSCVYEIANDFIYIGGSRPEMSFSSIVLKKDNDLYFKYLQYSAPREYSATFLNYKLDNSEALILRQAIKDSKRTTKIGNA